MLETNISNPRALVVQKVDNAIHDCNPVRDNAVGFPNTYSLESNLSSGYRYPPFEQLGPDETYNVNHTLFGRCGGGGGAGERKRRDCKIAQITNSLNLFLCFNLPSLFQGPVQSLWVLDGILLFRTVHSKHLQVC